MTIGILALQGAYQAHKKVFDSLGVHSIVVNDKFSLQEIDGLVLPGGESTTMFFLLKKFNLMSLFLKRVQTIPVLATCAGVILLQKSFVLPLQIQRNGYGRQLCSEVLSLKYIQNNASDITFDAFFIRAPIIHRIEDPAINILVYHKHYPVCIQKEKIIATTFHPELSSSAHFIHQKWLGLL